MAYNNSHNLDNDSLYIDEPPDPNREFITEFNAKIYDNAERIKGNKIRSNDPYSNSYYSQNLTAKNTHYFVDNPDLSDVPFNGQKNQPGGQ